MILEADAAIFGYPEFTIGTVDDRKGFCDEGQDIVPDGKLRLDQRSDFVQQRGGPPTFVWIALNHLENFPGHPLFRDGAPQPIAEMPEPAICAEHQVPAASKAAV